MKKNYPRNYPRNYPTAQLVPLTENERQLLANAVLGYGNMAKVVASVGVSDVTIRHAMAGLRLTPPVRDAIRGFLYPKAAKTAPPAAGKRSTTSARRAAQTAQP